MVDFLGLLEFAGDRPHLALPQAGQAAGAGLRVHRVLQQGPADQGRTFLLPDVGLVFRPEMLQGAEHRVRGALPQAADGSIAHDPGQFFQQG